MYKVTNATKLTGLQSITILINLKILLFYKLEVEFL